MAAHDGLSIMRRFRIAVSAGTYILAPIVWSFALLTPFCVDFGVCARDQLLAIVLRKKSFDQIQPDLVVR